MPHNRFTHLLLSVALCTGLTACASSPSQKVRIKQIYQQSAQYHKPDRNPIIVIPGILGSRLVDDATGQTVWGAFRANYADPGTSEGAQLVALSLDPDNPMPEGSVRPDGVLENLKLKLAGFPVSIQAYAGILTTLGAGGYTDQSIGLNSIDYGDDHFTCFQFDYDWRQDISSNAVRLKQFIDEKRATVQEQYEIRYGIKDAHVRFDIAAHSMGGLLTRYFLRYGGNALPEDGSQPALTWAGANDVERAVLIAPPNAGTLEAFDQLVNGFNTGGPLLPHYPPQILGTYPSVYQLLPRNRHKPIVLDGDENNPVNDIYDEGLWKKNEWGLMATDKKALENLSQLLPDVESDSERLAIASKFQRKALQKAKQFHQAMDVVAEKPDNIDLYLVAGDAKLVPEVISVDSDTGDISTLKTGVGDKTVLRTSALLDERIGGDWTPSLQTPIEWTSVLFVPSEHRKITSDPVFEDNVLYWLLEDPRD